MKKAMMITVGTGIGKDEEKATESLAHGIVKSMKNSNPGYVVFFVTEESEKKTIPEIKKQFPDMPEYELVEIEDMNDVNLIYEQASRDIGRLKDMGYEITIDFTSGTKAMSAGVTLAGIREFCTLSYVSGKRGKNNIVIKGTEKVITSEPVKAFIDMEEKMIRGLFNSYQYDSCSAIIKRLEEFTSDPDIIEKLNRYEQLVDGYSKWDKFDHRKALEILRTFDNSLVDIERNKKFLLEMERKGWRYELSIPDLLNNVKRRIAEGKYDDAVARLYRTIELMAQYRLKEEYDIDSSNVDLLHLRTLHQVEEKDIDKYEKMEDKEGKIKFPLNTDFRLLKDLKDEMGKWMDDTELRDLLSRRNLSILAHGLEPIERKTAESFFEKVKGYAKSIIDDLENLMEIAEFPKL